MKYITLFSVVLIMLLVGCIGGGDTVTPEPTANASIACESDVGCAEGEACENNVCDKEFCDELTEKASEQFELLNDITSVNACETSSDCTRLNAKTECSPNKCSSATQEKISEYTDQTSVNTNRCTRISTEHDCEEVSVYATPECECVDDNCKLIWMCSEPGLC